MTPSHLIYGRHFGSGQGREGCRRILPDGVDSGEEIGTGLDPGAEGHWEGGRRWGDK